MLQLVIMGMEVQLVTSLVEQPFCRTPKQIDHGVGCWPGNRKIMMLLDNDSSHYEELELRNVSLECLPSNTTTRPQPLDAGIIYNLEKSATLQFNGIESIPQSTYHLDILKLGCLTLAFPDSCASVPAKGRIACWILAIQGKSDRQATSSNKCLLKEQIKSAVTMFHAYGHKYDCQMDYNPRFILGYGGTDGEDIERFWSYLAGWLTLWLPAS